MIPLPIQLAERLGAVEHRADERPTEVLDAGRVLAGVHARDQRKTRGWAGSVLEHGDALFIQLGE